MKTSWIDGSVRPFESFWGVTQRFIMLNVAHASDFSDIYFNDSKFKEFSTNYASPCFKHQTFRQDLGISQADYDQMTLNSIKDTFADQTEELLKFCPICVNSLYQSIYFQIKWVRDCPIHNVKLLNKCQNCGRPISILFNRQMVQNPYCCPICHLPLYADKKNLLNPSIIEDNAEFKEIADWCRHVAKIDRNCGVIQKVRFNSSYMPSDWFYPLHTEISKMPLPSLLNACKESFVEDWQATYRCGLKVKAVIRLKDDKLSFRVSGLEASTYTAIFKSYYRYLIKKELGRYKRTIIAYRGLPYFCSPTARSRDIHEKYIAINTLIRRVHQYDDSKEYWFLKSSTPAKSLIRKFNFLNDTQALNLCRNTQEVEWVSSHMLIEELKSLYKEALIVSREMLIMEKVYECWPLSEKLLPCSFVYRDPKNEQLIYKCIQNRLPIESLKVTSPYEY